MRGHADSIALKLACHDPGVHRKLVPGGQQARAVFEAVEQARVEAIGARRMAGVAEQPHRDARRPLPPRQVRRGHRPRRRADRGRASRMMVRERLTGQAPPPAAKQARRAVAAVDRGPRRPRSRPARDADRGPGAVRRRRPRPARLARHGRGPQLRLRRGGEARRAIRTASKDETGEEGEGAESEDMQKMRTEDAEASGEDMSETDRRGGRTRHAGRDGRRRRDGRQPRPPAEPWRPRSAAERAARAGLQAVHHALRRDRRRRGAVRAGGARPAARLSRQAALAPAGRGRAARQPPAAPADGAAEPRLGVRPRGGPARPGAAAARHHRSAARAVVQAARRTPTSATPW